jgi:hypothetical protein
VPLQPIIAIAIEPSTDLQREQVHEMVKAHAEIWWHGIQDLWFVGGGAPGEWRDRIKPIFPTTEAGKVMVFKVQRGGGWAYRADFPESTSSWLRTNLAGGD